MVRLNHSRILCCCLAALLSAAAAEPTAGSIYEMKVQLVYDSTLAQNFNSTAETLKYLATFVQQMNTILAHRSLSQQVQLRLTMADNPPRRLSRADEQRIGLSHLHRPTGAADSSDRRAGSVLRQFCRFADAERIHRFLPDYGQALLLTGPAGSSGAPLGIAYRGGSCWPGVDCALLMVPKRRLFRIAFTAAHELGHGLRLGHRTGTGGVMMSQRLVADWPDDFRWAADSARQLRDEVEAMGERSVCIRRLARPRLQNVGRNEIAVTSNAANDVNEWQPDRVCQLVTDGHLPVSGVPFRSMQCRALCCRATAPASSSLSSVVSAGVCSVRISAFNGVACGKRNKGRCQNGVCIVKN